MRRNLDLVREILLWAESQPYGLFTERPVIANASDEEVGYHVHLMGQAGLAITIDVTTNSDRSPSALLLSVTWAGHDFLDLTKKPGVWESAKAHLLRPGLEVGWEVLLAWLRQAGAAGLMPP